jgi:putative ABC transport system permease protein
VRFFLPEEQYPTSEQQLAYFEQALERVRSHPEVASAGIAQSPPLSRAVVTLGGDLNLEVPGRSPENLAPLVGQYVTPGYFESLGVRMIRGRPFSEEDYRSKVPVVIVEDTFCRTRVGPGDPLQAAVRMGGTLYKIIGVTRDLRPDGPEAKARPTLYILRGPGQRAAFGHLVVRPTAVYREVAADIVRELVRIDARVVIDEPQSLRDLVRKNVAHRQRTLQLLMLAAGVLLLLTGFSVSGALSQFVEHRTREIALRKALGSSRSQTFQLVARYLAGPCSIGLAIGCVGGLFLGQRLSSELFGIQPGDPLTIALTLGAQIVLGAAAAVGPLWRAARIAPAIVLRGL